MPSPVCISTSMPRSAKISTARGLRASAMNTLGMIVRSEKNSTRETRVSAENAKEKDTYPLRLLCVLRLDLLLSRLGGGAFLGPGPFEPRQQRLDVAALDRGAGPDADTRRRGAVAGEVVAGTFGLDPRRH